MSLIVYDNGTLLTDRLATNVVGGVMYTKDMNKMFINPAMLYAVAYCGEEMLDRNRKMFMDAINVMLAIHVMQDRADKLAIYKEHMHLFGDRCMIIMMRDQVFVRDDNRSYFAEIELTDWVAMGTFSAAWRVARSYGQNTAKAAKTAITYVTGIEPNLSTLSRKDLRKFPDAKLKDELKDKVKC